MADLYNRTAFLATFDARIRARAEEGKLQNTRRQDRKREPQQANAAAIQAAGAPVPNSTAIDLQFVAVRDASLARFADEERAKRDVNATRRSDQRDGDMAAARILEAYRATVLAAGGDDTNDASDEAAVAAIMAALKSTSRP